MTCSKENSDYYLIEQVSGDLEDGKNVSLLINRNDGSFKVAGTSPSPFISHKYIEPMVTEMPFSLLFMSYGILGVFRLLAGLYVIVVTESHFVGRILDHSIWHIDQTRMLPCTLGHAYENDQEVMRSVLLMY